MSSSGLRRGWELADIPRSVAGRAQPGLPQPEALLRLAGVVCGPWRKNFRLPDAALVHPAPAALVSRCGDLDENKVTGERVVVLRGDKDNHGQSALVHLTARPHAAVVGEHPPSSPSGSGSSPAGFGTRIEIVERTLVAGQDWLGRPSVSQARYPRLSRV